MRGTRGECVGEPMTSNSRLWRSRKAAHVVNVANLAVAVACGALRILLTTGERGKPEK